MVGFKIVFLKANAYILRVNRSTSPVSMSLFTHRKQVLFLSSRKRETGSIERGYEGQLV